MRITLRFTFLFLSFASFSQDFDSTSFDTSYRLYDFNNNKMVDTSVRFVAIETEPPKRIRRAPSGGNYPIGSNYDSTHNVDPKIATLVSLCFLLFILYIIFRVWRGLKSDK